MGFSNEGGRRRKGLDRTTMEEEAIVLGIVWFFTKLSPTEGMWDSHGYKFCFFFNGS